MAERYGDYELIQQIATGGMAEIHLARQSGFAGLNRLVIIKRMLPQLAVRPEFVQMFLDEARLTASLQHPNIARVHDLGEVHSTRGGSYFIAMELVDGPHLGSLFAHSLRARRPLPIDLCVWICARAADGLHYAHELIDGATGQPLHLVHRDISPQNILVSKEGESKVTDFGVAKASNQQTKTRTGIIKGKVAYMSPEQCLGDQLDRRSDVFALGIVLYELVTRRRLFRDKSDLLIMQKITGEDVPVASSVNPSLDSDLDSILKKALSRDLVWRYQTAEEMAVALDEWLQNRVDEHTLASWFEENCAELAPSASLADATMALAQSGAEQEKTSSTPSLSSAETMRATAAPGPSSLAPSLGTALRDEPTALAPLPDFTATGPVPTAPLAADVALSQPPSFVAVAANEDVAVKAGVNKAALVGLAAAVVVLAVVGVVAVGASDEKSVAVVVDAGASAAAGPVNAAPAGALHTLKINTVPAGVSVIVGDRVVGKSPVEVEVPAGKAVVQAQFADQPPRTVEVEVAAGGSSEVKLQAWVPMVVKSTPKAKVKIDGVVRGETPWEQGFLVEPGREVKVRLEAPGMQPYEDAVTAAPGVPLVVEAKMAPAAVEPVRSDKVKREVEYGALSVRTEPWANVRLGDERLGETPFADKRVKAGKQTLVVNNPQFGINETFAVTVPKDRTLVVILRFEKQGTAFKLVQKTIR